MKAAKVTIDRCCNVIINRSGVAHLTGYVVLGLGVGQSPRLARGVGNMSPQRWPQFHIEALNAGTPISLPLSIADFERLTGWRPAGVATTAHRDM